MPRDVPLWEEFLLQYGDDYDSFTYDLHVGAGTDPGPRLETNLRQMAIALTQKRIDAVALKDGLTTLFEVKPHAGLSALGQILGYGELWSADHTGSVKYDLAVVTNTPQPDMPYLFSRFNIQLFEYPNVSR